MTMDPAAAMEDQATFEERVEAKIARGLQEVREAAGSTLKAYDVSLNKRLGELEGTLKDAIMQSEQRLAEQLSDVQETIARLQSKQESDRTELERQISASKGKNGSASPGTID